MLTQPPTEPRADTVPPSAMLSGKLTALRWRHLRVAAGTGLALMVVAGIELLALEMFLDWWLELPWAMRCLLLLGQVFLLGWLAFHFLCRPLWDRPDDDDLALMVERARPEFRSRLIASTQLTRPGALPPGASAALVEATVEETEAVAQPLDFRAVIPTERLRRLTILAGIVVLAGALGMGAGGAVTFDLLKRAFLLQVPVPRKTRVLVENGDQRIGRGDDVRLAAYAEGIVPATGTVAIKSASRRTQRFLLQAQGEDGRLFVRTVKNVQESFTYVIYLNDGRSDTFRVEVIPRPAVKSIECRQHYPGYTRLPPVRRALADLSLLAGSVLELQITSTKPVRTAALKPQGSNVVESAGLAVDAQDPTRLTGQLSIPAAGLHGFSVEMTDREGMESREAVLCRIEIIPDKPPAVELTYPDRKEELVTREAQLMIGLDVADDFQIGHVRVRYRVEAVEPGVEKSLELDLGGQELQRLQRRFIWDLGAFDPLLPEGAVIEYWLEAEDNNDVTGPGVGSSAHQLARVVSEAEKRADLLNRAGDIFSGVTDAASDQEQLNKKLGAIILEKTGP